MQDDQSCSYCNAEDVELETFRGEPLCPYCYGTFAGNEHVYHVYGLTSADSVILRSMMGAFNILEKRLRKENPNA